VKGVAGAEDEASADQGANKKMSNGQYGTMMVWLANDEKRNIVSGASGSATAGGNKFAQSKAKVVPKKQGYTALAAHINLKYPGSNWTADIAGKKFAYQMGLYSSAKVASSRSDWGLSQQELSKGITLQKKLESMCKDFSIWDTWFGHHQKYNPAIVLDSSVGAGESGGCAAAIADADADDSEFHSLDAESEIGSDFETGLFILTSETLRDEEEASLEKGLGVDVSFTAVTPIVLPVEAAPPPNIIQLDSSSSRS
jgi:hypothetical protein